MTMNLSIETNSPFSLTTPTLSPSPSKAMPQSAFNSFTFSFRIVRLDSTAGSGWWLGNVPSDSANNGIYSILSLLTKVSLATIDVVPLPQSYITFNLLS